MHRGQTVTKSKNMLTSYMRACLTPESLLLTVLLVFNSQLAYYYISRLKENTAQAAGIIILIKNPHEC